jgi:CO/xanthine dehydrogenase Mo-binding subunit
MTYVGQSVLRVEDGPLLTGDGPFVEDIPDIRIPVRPRGNPSLGIPPAELGCTGEHRYDKPLPTFDMGACLAQVAVDRETGAVSVLRIVVCHDIGQAVNPRLVDGQLVGGAAQGVGGTLFEELAYDPQGQPLATSFMDYLMPTAAEVPPVDTVGDDGALSRLPLTPDALLAIVSSTEGDVPL